MSDSRTNKNKGLLFYCTRQSPEPELIATMLGTEDIVRIEVPCAGRIGTGELMLGISEGYNKVGVLSCGEKACLHGFGCTEAKKAFEKAVKFADVAGVDTDRLIFIERDQENT